MWTPKQKASTTPFYSFHFSYYNRFSNRVRGQVSLIFFFLPGIPKGDGTPADADPTTLTKDGRRKINTCQNIPRRSNELKDRPEEYLQLQDTLMPIFEWLRQQVCS